MAVAPISSPETLDMKPEKFETEVVSSTSQDLSPFPQPASTPSAPAPAPAGPTASAANENPSLSPIPTTPTPNPQNPVPNSNDNPTTAAPPPPSIPSFAPSFRPLVPPSVQQYPNPNYPMAPSPGIQPPGVTAPGVSVMHPGGAGAMTFSTQPSWLGMYPFVPGQSPATAAVGYGQVPSGYMTVPGAPMQAPPGVPPLALSLVHGEKDRQASSLQFFKDLFHFMLLVLPVLFISCMHVLLGIARYPAPYPTFVRPGFPPHPMPPMGVVPQFPRLAIPGVRPVVTPVVRPVVPIVAPTEKPQTTVYVGKIAPTVDNDFLLSLLRLCGPVKSWKRAQDPSDGTPKGFGFCEFESVEGILRAMRLLSKLNIDRQELVLNINQATREYLERYVEKKTEREQLKETEAQVAEKENEGAAAPGVAKQKDGENSGDKENLERTQNFGIVTDEDRDADRDALEKITHMIDERLKMKPLPPPPPVQTPVDGSAKSNSEVPSKSRDGDSDADIMKSDAAEVKNDDETTSENKPVTEPERPKTSTPDKSRRHDRSSRERDRELDMKRDKELELERYERERERVRIRRERERERELQYAERIYKDRVKEWEAREREKENQREKEKEREKEYQREHRREILKDENESDDDDTRKRRHRSRTYEERRRKRQREKEEDLADRLKEEEEIAEAKRRAIEAQLSADDLRPLPSQVSNESDKPVMQEAELHVEGMENVPDHVCECVPTSATNMGDGNYINNSSDELTVGPVAVSTIKQNSNVPSRKLGFGLVGSGKRTAVPSVFNEEDDEDADEKKMRPLVPIDYSTEELQAVQPSVSGPSLSLAAAAEFAKHISTVDPKEDKPGLERERNGRSIERLSQKERDRSDEQNTHARNGSKLRMQDKIFDREKPKTDNKKLLDAKQLIDMIPKTKEELFAYEINWVTYDKYELHERMRPWISKKITEFLGEEEPTLVDYIVSSTKDHVQASKMLELLQSILDDEAAMFVLKMWRMLIFEIKKVEAGLSGKSRG